MTFSEYLLYIPFCLAFARIAYTDHSRREIGNRAVSVMLACGLVRLLLPGQPWEQLLFCGAGMALFCFILWCGRKDDPGGGDIKLLPALALNLGLYGLLAALAVALALIGCVSLRCKEQQPRYPLAAYLFLAWLLCLPFY